MFSSLSPYIIIDITNKWIYLLYHHPSKTIAMESFHLGLGLECPAFPSPDSEAALKASIDAPPARVVADPKNTRVQIAYVPTVDPKECTGTLRELWTRCFFDKVPLFSF